ncbi:MAG: hypothetical protein HY329_22125 [Chloroflexi bacterium]|nr:hypothetical protein [Chloroflexota bacterium]
MAKPLSDSDRPSDAVAWAEGCLDAERRHGQLHARLFPLLGQGVRTPQGAGKLDQVFEGRATVILERSPTQLTYFAIWS